MKLAWNEDGPDVHLDLSVPASDVVLVTLDLLRRDASALRAPAFRDETDADELRALLDRAARHLQVAFDAFYKVPKGDEADGET